MGIITNVYEDIDTDTGEKVIVVVTEFGINTRAALNRVAGRATLTAGLGQRTLVAAAYDTEGIDLVWSEGIFGSIAPEDKFPKAKEIEYKSFSIESASNFLDILTPRMRPKFRDFIEFGKHSGEEVVHVWKIPAELS